MGNRAPKNNSDNPRPPHLHKRTATESELYNFRDNIDSERSTQHNLMEFISNQNQLNALLKSYLLETLDRHNNNRSRFKKSQLTEEFREKEKDMLVEIPHCHNQHKPTLSHLRKWIEEVTHTVCEEATRDHSKGELPQEQISKFCVQNILENMSNLSQQIQLTSSQLQQLQQYVLTKLLPTLGDKNRALPMRDIIKMLSNTDLSQHAQVLVISVNSDKQSKTYDSQYGADFLDQRDRVCEYQLQFKVQMSYKQMEQPQFNFMNSQAYQTILKHIKHYLLQCIPDILSIGFRSLSQHRMLLDEAKNYVALNILHNVQSTYQQCIAAIDKCTRLKNKIDSAQLSSNLIMQLDQTINSILLTLTGYYTYHPSHNQLQYRQNIPQLDRSSDDTYDLLHSNHINIAKYYSPAKQYKQGGKTKTKTQDYSQFIMQAVNAAIRATHTYEEDCRERTVAQIFAQFNQQLFALAQNSHFRSLVQSATDQSSPSQQASMCKRAVSNYFKPITQTNPQQLRQIERAMRRLWIDTSRSGEQNNNKERKNELFQYSQSFSQRLNNYEAENRSILHNHHHSKAEVERVCARINSQKQRQLQNIRRERQYTFQQQVPAHVRPFTKQQISGRKLAGKHPAIVWLLAEWGGNLQRVFMDAEQVVMKRAYPFTDISNQKMYLSVRQKQQLLHNLNKEYSQVQLKLQALKNKHHHLIAHLFHQPAPCLGQTVLRFAQTRQASSKINTLLLSLLVQYLNVLITHLLKAGQLNHLQSKQNCHLNLILFGITNLLKVQYSCDYTTLSAIIRTLQVIDDCQSMQRRVRLVRIADNSNSTGRVIVNYMFMDILQCQVELSMQQPQGREKHYLNFGRFIQQLTHHKLGVLSNVAHIIAKYDPMLSHPQTHKQQASPYKQQPQQQQLQPSQNNNQELQSQWSSCILKTNTIQCEQCGNLILQSITSMFNADSNMCLKCHLLSEDCIFRLKNSKLKKVLLQNTKQGRITRVLNYSQLKITNQKFIPILSVGQNGRLQFKIVVFIRNELSHFVITVTHKTIKDVIENSINYRHIEYHNISQLVKQRQSIADDLVFEVSKVQDLSRQALQLMGFNYKQQVEHIFENATKLAQQFELYRKEKNLIKSIKFKAEIINCDHDTQKWHIFANLLKVYNNTASKPPYRDAIKAKLKYNRYKTLHFDTIKFIHANHCNIQTVPQEISLCSNLRELVSKESQIRDGLSLKLKKLRHLNLQHNFIEKTLPSTELKELQYLDLTSNQLETTDSLASLTTLKELNLSCNQLQRVDGLSFMVYLTRLSLKQNQLQNIQGLANLSNLSYLQLSANKLRDVDSLSNLTNLTHLYLGWNELADVNGLWQLVKLKVLDLNCNELRNVDGLASLTNLRQLYLSSNSLRSMANISSLVGLNKLVLSFNQLQGVDFLTKNINLEFLSLNDNQLRASVSFKHLYKLKEISVQDNQQLKITDLPVSLQKLYADMTAVENIDFQNMISLKQISVKGPLRTAKLKNVPQGVEIKTID